MPSAEARATLAEPARPLEERAEALRSALSPAEALERLASGPRGLSEEEAGRRLAAHGPNRLARLPGPSLWKAFLAQFTHLMALLLWVGGAVALVARMPELAVAIWAVIAINGVFGFWQEYRALRAAEILERVLPRQARVRRDGVERVVPAERLVPGDLMVLAGGDAICADGRLVEAADLRVDQSILSGEADPVRKAASPWLGGGLTRTETPNLVFAGSAVTSGRGVAVVCATGMDTEFGAISRLTQAVPTEPSPLQVEMSRVTRTVTAVAVAVGAAFFALSVGVVGMDLAQGFLFATGMIVAFVPEGLLPTVTLALALGVQRMASRQALVKKLSAVETLGCTEVICTDKTGTLTRHEMTVRQVWCGRRTLEVTGSGYEPAGRVEGEAAALALLLQAGAQCNDARLLPPEGAFERWRVLGDPTEAALLVLAGKGGVDREVLALREPRVAEVPFDARRKRMSTVHTGPSGVRLWVKGAVREVLDRCAEVHLDEGVRALDDGLRQEALEALDRMARGGLRVLALAGKVLPERPSRVEAEELERDLVLFGLAGLMDPPRSEVAAAVETCRRAGIRVVMVTGDYGLTAESVARRIGILGPGPPTILTGADLDRMDDGELDRAAAGEVLFARASPEHKLRIVKTFQRAGRVVAVTGDGVNDAPALRQADIGVAMGQSGTDVAREAADMVLADDSFASIVAAVEEGRTVYANIRRFCSYIFTSNTPEAIPFILHALSGGRIPLALTIMQILSIDLGTDLVPALALGAEPAEPGLMDEPPRDRSHPLIDAALLSRAYLVLGPVQSLAAMSAFWFAGWSAGLGGGWAGLPSSGPLYAAATTMTLAAVVSTQIGNLFAHRARGAAGGNRMVPLGIATEVTFLGLLAGVPLLQRVFGTAPIPLEGWLYVAAWMPALYLVDRLCRRLDLFGR